MLILLQQFLCWSRRETSSGAGQGESDSLKNGMILKSLFQTMNWIQRFVNTFSNRFRTICHLETFQFRKEKLHTSNKQNWYPSDSSRCVSLWLSVHLKVSSQQNTYVFVANIFFIVKGLQAVNDIWSVGSREHCCAGNLKEHHENIWVHQDC